MERNISKKDMESAKDVFAEVNKKLENEIEIPVVKELSPKYIVLKRKNIHNIEKHNDTTNSFVFIFKDSKNIKEFKEDTKYFVMELDDEFNITDLQVKLQDIMYRDRKSPAKIMGSELALVILNSTADKSKLKVKS